MESGREGKKPSTLLVYNEQPKTKFNMKIQIENYTTSFTNSFHMFEFNQFVTFS